MKPSQEYRTNLRYAVRVLASPEHDGLRLPEERISNMTMGDLEAFNELLFGKPLTPPAGYRNCHA